MEFKWHFSNTVSSGDKNLLVQPRVYIGYSVSAFVYYIQYLWKMISESTAPMSTLDRFSIQVLKCQSGKNSNFN